MSGDAVRYLGFQRAGVEKSLDAARRSARATADL